jgi:periplasmic divalent cation tolerance protein
MSHELVVFATVPTNDEASKIAEALVAERLAACVNIIPAIESVYRWEGAVTRDREVLLVIKTTDERYSDLERRLKALHSYSTPEVIAFRIRRGSEDYLRWLRESVMPDADEDTPDSGSSR